MSLTPHLVITPSGAVPVVKGWGFEPPQVVHVKLTSQHGVMMEASSRPQMWCVVEIANLKYGVSTPIATVRSVEWAVHVRAGPLQRSFLDNRRFESQGGFISCHEAIPYLVAHGRRCWCFREANDWRWYYFETRVVFDGFIQPLDEFQITCCIP
jgi:hypothetical protein